LGLENAAHLSLFLSVSFYNVYFRLSTGKADDTQMILGKRQSTHDEFLWKQRPSWHELYTAACLNRIPALPVNEHLENFEGVLL
jgi:hypothetical protein